MGVQAVYLATGGHGLLLNWLVWHQYAPSVGEGSQAFRRLQEELVRKTDDHSIFAWSHKGAKFPVPTITSCLAPSPEYFMNSADIVSFRRTKESKPFVMTSRGVEILLYQTPERIYDSTFILDCGREGSPSGLGINLVLMPGIGEEYGRRGGDLLEPHLLEDLKRKTVPIRTTVVQHTGRLFDDSGVSVKVMNNKFGPPGSQYRLTKVYPQPKWSLDTQSLMLARFGGASNAGKGAFRFQRLDGLCIDILVQQVPIPEDSYEVQHCVLSLSKTYKPGNLADITSKDITSQRTFITTSEVTFKDSLALGGNPQTRVTARLRHIVKDELNNLTFALDLSLDTISDEGA